MTPIIGINSGMRNPVYALVYHRSLHLITTRDVLTRVKSMRMAKVVKLANRVISKNQVPIIIARKTTTVAGSGICVLGDT